LSVTINGIVCEEIVDGLEEGIDSGGPRASKKYLCAWASRYTVANGLMGLSAGVGGPGGSVTLTHPAFYPESHNLFARSLRIVGKGKPSQGTNQLQFTQAIIAVEYGVPPFGFTPADDPGGGNSIDPSTPMVYATQEIDMSMEAYTIPASAVQVTSPTAPVAKDITIYYAKAEIAITLHQIPYLPAQLIFSKVGNLNSVAFLGCAIGKLRFNGGKTHRTASTDGTFTQDVSLSFSYRSIARWDYQFHPNGTAGWVALQDKSGNNLYTLSDLSVLIPASYRF
jgi:hypothetical protein